MADKKKNTKKNETPISTLVSKEKFEAAKADLAKMITGIQGGEKLLELVDAGYKKGKLSSGEMMEVLESLSLESEQLDKIYDVLENLGWTPPGRTTWPAWTTTPCSPRATTWRSCPRRSWWTPTPWWTPLPSTTRCACT